MALENKDVTERDLEKELVDNEKKDKEKKSYENIKKSWDLIASQAMDVSPEANENWAVDLVKTKFDKKTKEIEEKFNKWWMWEKERDEQMNEATNEFLWDIKTLVWTKEGSQAKQTKDFWEHKSKENKDYAKKLEEFNKQLQVMKEFKEWEKRIKDKSKMNKVEEQENNEDPIKEIMEKLINKETPNNWPKEN